MLFNKHFRFDIDFLDDELFMDRPNQNITISNRVKRTGLRCQLPKEDNFKAWTETPFKLNS